MFKVAIIPPKYNDIEYTSNRKLYLPSQDQPNFIELNKGSTYKLYNTLQKQFPDYNLDLVCYSKTISCIIYNERLHTLFYISNKPTYSGIFRKSRRLVFKL